MTAVSPDRSADLHDAVVVGGGAAGLAAATWLARYRRSVVLVDSGDYRAAAVEVSHGYLGRDPQSPLDLLATGREQLGRYATARYRKGVVVAAERVGEEFLLRCEDGQQLRALRIVLATGVVDACPAIEGFDLHYGASAFHCPACDGYDVQGRDVIAYGWDERLVGFATGLLDWARSVTVLTSGNRFDGDDACRAVLDRHRVRIIETPARRMLGDRGDLRGVELTDGSVVEGSVLFFSVAHQPRTDLAQALGCDLDEDGYVEIDTSGHTSVPGVLAAGDVVPGLQLVQVAAAQGTAAGVAAALSLHGEPGSPHSPAPAPDAAAEVEDVRN